VGQTSPQNSYASGISVATAGQISTFTIQGVDQFQNPMINGGATFAIELESENVTFNITDNGDGTYTASCIKLEFYNLC
jgi:hypothetical protein